MARRRSEPPRTGGLELDLFGGATAPREGGRGKREASARAAAPPASHLPPPDVVVESLEELGDAFPGASASSAVDVSTLTMTAKDVLESAFLPIWVRGEVSDFRMHRNGHWYFCLRDASAQIRCVVWSRDRRGIPAPPDDGMQVTALGQLTVYAARGDMQLTVRRMEAAGDGLWRKALELTRARLAADGLLADERKRPLPRHPRRIAMITSPDGAALHDVRAVLRRRAPWVELVVVPAAVQGELAVEQLVAALGRVGRWGDCDLVIVGRGGGAREDLWAFNEEAVVRAVAECPIPTISAVGHEIDVTLCDLVADHRAPTPSAAAEAAVRSQAELTAALSSLAGRLRGGIDVRVADARDRLRWSADAVAARAGRVVERRQAHIAEAAGRLHALSPLATLGRGYAVARGADGRTLTTTSEFTPGMPFDLILRDGIVGAKAERRAPSAEGLP